MNKLVLDHCKTESLVSKIAREIAIGDWKPDYIVGLTRGGLIPAVMLSHYLDVPLHTLNVSLRDHKNAESNLWMAEDAITPSMVETGSFPQYEHTRKNILIVDDINDTGATVNWIIDDWTNGCDPNNPLWENDVWNVNVRFAMLVDNLASDAYVKMDYTGMEINKAENDVWVDFPWEDWWTK